MKVSRFARALSGFAVLHSLPRRTGGGVERIASFNEGVVPRFAPCVNNYQISEEYMKNYTMFIRTLIITFLMILAVGCPKQREVQRLSISISYEIIDGKLFINGESNLPENMKIGVEISNQDYLAQDYKIFIKSDGTFESLAFTNKGAPLKGNYDVLVFSYFNNTWQENEILETLKYYVGDEIVDRKKIEVKMNISL